MLQWSSTKLPRRKPQTLGECYRLATRCRSPPFVDARHGVTELHPERLRCASRMHPANNTLSFPAAGLFSKERESQSAFSERHLTKAGTGTHKRRTWRTNALKIRPGTPRYQYGQSVKGRQCIRGRTVWRCTPCNTGTPTSRRGY